MAKTMPDGSLHWEAENFTGGASPVAGEDYQDKDPGNRGDKYRQSDVDIYALPDGTAHFVGRIQKGEWLRYRFEGGGRYKAEFRYSNQYPSGIQIKIDGKTVTGRLSPPRCNKNEWRTFKTPAPFEVQKGPHDIYLLFSSNDLMLDYFRLVESTLKPPPDAAARKEAEELVRELFKSDYAKRKAADLQALAKTLLQEGGNSQNDATSMYVLLNEARLVASKAGDLTTALQAIDGLAGAFILDIPALKEEALSACARSAGTRAAQAVIATEYLDLAEIAVNADDLDKASSLARTADSAARKARDLVLVERSSKLTKRITRLKADRRRLESSLKKLETNPDDPDANLEVGLYRAFGQGDWETGLPHLAKGSDKLIAAAGKLELTKPTEAKAVAAVGDAWVEAAGKKSGDLKRQISERAIFWYEKALPGLNILDRKRVENALQDLLKATSGTLLGKGLVFWMEAGRDMQNGLREYVSGSRATNKGALVSNEAGTRALKFRNDHVDYGASPAVRAISTNGSVFAWIHAGSFDQLAGIVNRGMGGIDEFGLWVFGEGKIGSWFNFPSNKTRFTSTAALTDGKWNMAGYVWDSKSLTFYINGQRDRTTAHLGVPQKRTNVISIGSNPPGGHDYFDGHIGMVVIYSRTLSSAEIIQLYRGTRLKFN